MRTRSESGFTFVELVVVVLILVVLAGVLVPRVSNRMAAGRDARRLSDLDAVQDAIESYWRDHGEYPAPRKNGSFGGWDVSHDGDFIPVLREEGYLREAPADPINDATHHYRYYVYDQGSYGCAGQGRFYVLGIRKFETEAAAGDHAGFFRCSSRDWSNEFDHVTGGGATY